MGKAQVIFSIFPRGRYGGEQNAARLGRRHYYLPGSFSYEEIDTQETMLASQLGLIPLDSAKERADCDKALENAKSTIGTKEIAIDYTLHPRPLGLARLLLSHGFSVKKVYLDSVSSEELQDFYWLKRSFPNLTLCATIQPQLRVLPRNGGDAVLALGQIAAWAEATPYFVNLVEGAGLWGYAGIRSLARYMEAALEEKKNVADLVPRKGLGCESLI